LIDAALRRDAEGCTCGVRVGRARVADQQLNRWDEAFAYLAIALSVDLWGQL
jgi:hypothetical protein